MLKKKKYAVLYQIPEKIHGTLVLVDYKKEFKSERALRFFINKINRKKGWVIIDVEF